MLARNTLWAALVGCALIASMAEAQFAPPKPGTQSDQNVPFGQQGPFSNVTT